jgi:stearoyl-CoA desaturase (Delta-9 desaturase)
LENQSINQQTERRPHWVHIITLGLIHACALLGLWFWPRSIDLVLFFGLYLATGLGITIGYHRLLTHRSFKCHTWMRRLLTWLGCAALQDGPSKWVAIHRRHHQLADHAGDPHSPNTSFFHAHVGWTLIKDEKEGEDYKQIVPDVSGNDRWMRILDRGYSYVLPWLLSALLCYVIAGWRGVLWGAIIRTVWVWHLTWSVNSVCHWRGLRKHETRDRSRNVWWVGILTFGEGWHNNHHARPSLALHGREWYEVDISGYIIRLLRLCGLTWNVVNTR